MPLISVIVPVYNVENYIGECLESIISQSLNDIEIICVNDGSTDSSLKILEQYANADARIIVISQDNKGLSEARNVGIEVATGKYICFVDGDDIISSGALESIKSTIDENVDIQIIAYETAELLYENGLPRDKNKDLYYMVKKDYPGIKLGRDLFVELIENGDFVESAWLLAINRTWLNEHNIRFVPEAYFEDSAFSLECYFQAERMIHIKERIYIYRIRRNSIMTSEIGYKHGKWRVRQFENCLKYIFAYAKNEREVKALSLYARQIMHNIKYIYGQLSDDDKDRISSESSLNSFILESLGLDFSKKYNKNLLLDGMLRKIENAGKVVLYGAGNVGKKLLRLLILLNMDNKIVGYAVSVKQAGKSLVEGKQVKNINEYVGKNIDLVIISTCNYHEEMVDLANKAGFYNLILVNDEIESLIDVMIERKQNEKGLSSNANI